MVVTFFDALKKVTIATDVQGAIFRAIVVA
jgi:hypothetical protein